MNKYEVTEDVYQTTTAIMREIRNAILKGDVMRVESLLSNRVLDSIQKDYFIDMAKRGNRLEIVEILKHIPTNL